MSGEPLSTLVLRERPEALADALSIERSLTRMVDEATKQWPQIRLAPAEFVAYVTPRLARELSLADAIDQCRPGELYLAAACLLRVPQAAEAFEHHYMVDASRAVRSLHGCGDQQSEVLQRVRTQLLVGTESRPPALTQYKGIGSLSGWVRTTAVRTALNMIRAGRRDVPLPDLPLPDRDGWLEAEAIDPDVDVIRRQYRVKLEEATELAFAQLADEQRELLRLYVIERLTLDELAGIHGVQAPTVSRWLKRIRAKLRADAESHLAHHCGLDSQECESVVRAVQSTIVISVARLLASA